MWRKNRQPNSESVCVGTDLNRNYPYKWGGKAPNTRPIWLNPYFDTNNDDTGQGSLKAFKTTNNRFLHTIFAPIYVWRADFL